MNIGFAGFLNEVLSEKNSLNNFMFFAKMCMFSNFFFVECTLNLVESALLTCFNDASV